MNRRAVPALALATVTASCSPLQTVGADFDSLNGQPLAVAEAKLGVPASRRASANGTISVWTDRVRDDTPINVEKVVFTNDRPTTIQVRERPESRWTTCILTVLSDSGGTIASVERTGTSTACAPMARKIVG